MRAPAARTGNAKTLMFVNVSPTDYNLDETQNSLQYATRVRTIKVRMRAPQVWHRAAGHGCPPAFVRWGARALLPSTAASQTLHCPLSFQNDATKNESNKDMLRLKQQVRACLCRTNGVPLRLQLGSCPSGHASLGCCVLRQVDFWKEQAGLPAEMRTAVDLSAVESYRPVMAFNAFSALHA